MEVHNCPEPRGAPTHLREKSHITDVAGTLQRYRGTGGALARWRDAHDYIASTVFDLVSLAGISGRGAEWHLQHGCPGRGLGRCTGRGMAAVARGPALSQTIASFTVDGRRMLYDVKRISFCPSRYWPMVAVASSRGGALEYRASLVRTEYEAAASALDARTAAWYRRMGTAAPVGAPTAVDILASFPPVRGLVFGSTACGGPGRSASSLLRLRRCQPSVSGARLAPAPCSTRGPS